MSDNLPTQDLDLSFLYEIADGSDEFIVDSIGMFLEQTPQLLDAISMAINTGDWVVAAQSAHKLKPNLGFFGMPLSQANIQEVELACKAGGANPAEITAKFNTVKQVVENNLIALEKIKREKEANL
ncbi:MULTISPECIES: Hpt domain-containing protein [unclassified Mucilaginibacter]|uniref:Hpt domain-containing protein n=1 Tax=unclassified Mucilaginibacter TaxID=2617802 RepID=UPI00138CA0C4|nr:MULTISPECIES: Hpt domain-containing protein [unclassified Mucilaginibacter]MBB5397667.1 HPt (histidine-containing phosphotransfer) domain-containing protein [Mucilaginibacter sp. AK015]QHS57688.1 Hpt domain-containing protein [Mucilaginibacter sp. 14171R-50]